jgi:alginate O-acetyltransferase complex protein AlgI
VIFLSYWFVCFAVIALALYYLFRNTRLRLPILFVSCAVFHTHFAGPAGVLPIVVLAVTTYFFALTRRKRLCVLGICLNVCALVLYKYLAFISAKVLGSLFPTLGQSALDALHSTLPSAPPLAISFFVFEFVHYLYDVRKGAPPLVNPLHFGVFAIFWPSIVSGPIKRFEQFIPSLLKGNEVVSTDITVGLGRVAIGLVKKVIADDLTIWIEFHTPQFSELELPWRWFFFFALAVRIYLDFSGYSDIAIGYARVMGIRIPENFNWPYLARSIDDFWRRWHISLSSWIRDYVYIPLGGSRRGLPRRVANGLVAFALCGLWHGADWNFLLWGIYHGLGLAVCANYRRLPAASGRSLELFLARAPLLSWALTLLFVCVGWLLFFFPADVALRMLGQLFAGDGPA